MYLESNLVGHPSSCQYKDRAPLFLSIVTFLSYFSRWFSQYFVETRTDDRLTLQSHLSLLPSMERLLRLAGSGWNARKDNYTGWVIRNEDKKPSFIRL